ncbi:hypothetical protein PFISCL1PPCAC_3365, partial [Pristionchus fissidentatus]
AMAVIVRCFEATWSCTCQASSFVWRLTRTAAIYVFRVTESALRTILRFCGCIDYPPEPDDSPVNSRSPEEEPLLPEESFVNVFLVGQIENKWEQKLLSIRKGAPSDEWRTFITTTEQMRYRAPSTDADKEFARARDQLDQAVGKSAEGVSGTIAWVTEQQSSHAEAAFLETIKTSLYRIETALSKMHYSLRKEPAYSPESIVHVEKNWLAVQRAYDSVPDVEQLKKNK